MTYVRETLESLRTQTLQSYELLVLYNGVDRKVEQEFEQLTKMHASGRVLSKAERVPMFANFNRGLSEARGKYVVFFHDDDVYEPNFLEQIIAALEAHPSAAFAGSNYYIIDESGRRVDTRRLIGKTELQPGFKFISELIHRGRGAVPTPGIVFRKDAFDERGWDERLSMHFGDFIVMMRMAETHDVMLISDPLLRLRLHGKNASNVPMSVAAPMQFNTIVGYIREFAARKPGNEKHFEPLLESAKRALVRGLTWGWLSATSDEEGDACRDQMRTYAPGRAWLLGLLGGVGMRAARRGRIAAIVRKLGRRIG
jgi:glycosyltransferase involved in cell wall biosynthesis